MGAAYQSPTGSHYHIPPPNDPAGTREPRGRRRRPCHCAALSPGISCCSSGWGGARRLGVLPPRTSSLWSRACCSARTRSAANRGCGPDLPGNNRWHPGVHISITFPQCVSVRRGRQVSTYIRLWLDWHLRPRRFCPCNHLISGKPEAGGRLDFCHQVKAVVS